MEESAGFGLLTKMSESEATAGLQVPTIAEGEKVKAINGVKEMEQETEVRLQNGDSGKPQINGDLGKEERREMEEASLEQNGDSGGNEEAQEKEGPDIAKEAEEKSEEKVEEVVEEDAKAEEEKESEGEKATEEPMEVESKESEKENTDGATEETKPNAEEETEKKTDETKEEAKPDTKEETEKKEEAAKEDEAESKEKKEADTPKTPKKKDKKADKDVEEVKEITPTRILRVRKTPKKYTDDDDDIKITQEVIKDDSSDIEMIEESDPLAISDADVKKAQNKKEQVKKDPNVIIIDTNTLLKNQGNLAAAVAQSGGGSGSGVSTVTQTTSGHSNTVSNVNIQTAIQAITGGVPAQGLQSAYITALQQVLLAQGGQVPMNSQHLAQLQQYYNSLGHLQDDAYVIEAPSFIVPYVMEGKPKEPIQKFLKRINKELEEFDKKKKEEEDKKKEEEKKKKKGDGEEDEEEEEEEEEKEKEKEKGDKEDDKEEVKAKNKEEEKEEDEEEEEEEKKKKEGDTEKQEKEEEEKDKEEKMEVDAKKDEKEGEEEEEEEDEKKEKEEEEEKEKDSEKTNKDDKDTKDKDAKVKSKDDENKENKETNKENKKEGEIKDKLMEVDLTDEKKDEDLSFLGKWETYYKSALGKFFLDLGLSQAQEFLQSDLLRMQKKRLDKMKTAPSKEGIMGVRLLEKQLNMTKEKNAHLRLPLKICKFCNFKTESEMVMERHLESPHMVNYTYKCNFCDFETRGPQVILFHMEAEHNVRGRLERAPAFFQCSLCPYEDNNKSKMTRHSFSCSKKYKPEKNCEMLDWEPPAKIPKLFPSAFQVHRGRPNTLGKAFEPVRMPHLLPKGMQGMNIIQTGNLQSANLQASNVLNAAGRGRGRPVGSYKTTGTGGSLLYQARGVTTSGNLVGQSSGSRVPRILPSSSASSVSLIPGLAASSSITIQSVQSKAGNTKSPQQPSISITPLPRAGQPPQTVTKGATPTRDASGKPSFVICEICDGYIKDLEQLRNHMNLIHKVKIHPKMIYNRPPLNCQKCQHRFFTDQGLERHLLGTHGLVTSSMQEAANKGKDAGRCPICGKVFQWKLLNHVSRDHKMTLKPAHLSYKCTVCTATFNMYRLFENHVYSAHSVVNKNKEGGKQKNSGSTESPLKINDEITIIPQPASKTSSKASDKSTASSKKADSTPTVSKEITITKVGSRPTRRSGSSVEVISIDESPSKKRSNKDAQPQSSNPKRARTSS